jgi:GNAT superfamily N-acetyltransferase
VKRPQIVPFADEHLDGAVVLLAERHARHRASEPLLPDGVDLREEISREREDGGGVAAVEDGAVVGYLLGRRREDQIGPHIWSNVAGHAVREAELVRDLYAAAAARWVEAGLSRHFVFVPALRDLVDPWFRLCFGASAALAMRETAPAPAGESDVVIREGEPADAEAAARLELAMVESMLPSPSFSRHEPPSLEVEVEEWAVVWTEPDRHKLFVAERDGRVVGHVLLWRRPPDLRVPVDGIDLAGASTEAALRGSGIGVALTNHAIAWAHEQGYPTMTTDWRTTNLLASRFWPRRGFRETFLRLYRSIP